MGSLSSKSLTHQFHLLNNLLLLERPYILRPDFSIKSVVFFKDSRGPSGFCASEGPAVAKLKTSGHQNCGYAVRHVQPTDPHSHKSIQVTRQF